MNWLRRVVERLVGKSAGPGDVVPTNPQQLHTIERSDAYLEHPRIKALLAKRDREMRESFARGGHRLSGR